MIAASMEFHKVKVWGSNWLTGGSGRGVGLEVIARQGD